MTDRKLSPNGRPSPTANERRERLALRVEEGIVAWADYQAENKAALDRMPKLRELRLAQSSKRPEVPIKKLAEAPIKKRKKAVKASG